MTNPSPEAMAAAERICDAYSVVIFRHGEMRTEWDVIPPESIAALIDAAYAERLERLERENERLRASLGELLEACNGVADMEYGEDWKAEERARAARLMAEARGGE